MDEVNKRNAESIRVKLEEMNTRLYKQDEVIRSQLNAINSLVERIASVEQQLIILKVRLTGTGPSV